jgi:type IV fimbrial biogenesis protein FimT
VLDPSEGRFVLNRPASGGFTLVELLIGVTILAVILGLAVPSMGTYLQNSKLASATQDYYAGLQRARAEAIHSNLPVQFVLTDTPVDTANLANTVVPSVTGQNWAVRAASDPAATSFNLVEAKGAQEGSFGPGASGVQATASGPAGFAGLITFNGLGGTSDGLPYSLDISNAAAGVCAAAGGAIRCKRINITPGGRISACDPAALAADSRYCQP